MEWFPSSYVSLVPVNITAWHIEGGSSLWPWPRQLLGPGLPPRVGGADAGTSSGKMGIASSLGIVCSLGAMRIWAQLMECGACYILFEKKSIPVNSIPIFYCW